MDKRKGLIEDFKKEIHEARENISLTLSELGMYLFENHKKETRTAAQDAYDSIKHLADQIQSSEENKQRILHAADRLNEIAEETDGLDDEIDSLERANQPIYEAIGEAAFRSYRENPEEFSGHEEIFSSLEQQESEIEDIDSEIESLARENRTKKFFEKIADRGQTAYLKGLRLLRIKGYSKLFSQAGKELADSGLLDKTRDTKVLEAAGPYLENKEHLDGLKKKRSALEAEREKLNGELQEAGIERKPDRKIDELTAAIEKTDRAMRDKLKEIAREVRIKMPDKIAADKAVQEYLSGISEDEEKIDRFNENIKKLEAAIHAEAVGKQIERMRENIENHKERIQEHKSAVKDLEEKITEAEKEKSRLEKVRGPQEIAGHG